MSNSSSLLKLGKEVYGKMKIEEAFLKALELYFRQDKKRIVE
ncbi:hypothetical protein OCB08_01390 [Bacillus cereus]|nr:MULTISPECIES: hypothetical protein [Bacillus cereus group]AOM07589.1 hypothetical protein FORC24_4299 [Bacillus cereus]MCU5624067.1 hypothetical protein [Bacillus cereus]MDF9549481.1 hypothetical protein [Bacillus cereus]MDF9600556.1 hypothetical protein [Bacillus cereus]MED0825330.1 hypothetical protein [Bacillus pacificus]